jgi:hypothetical protein
VDIPAYWRPRGDTGIGFHYYPDLTHYTRSDLAFWTTELKQLGASWIVLLSDLPTPIPDYWIREFVGAGIEPLVRLYTPHVTPLDHAALSRICTAYAQLGVHYLHVYNEPNLINEWQWSDWSKPALVDRFMELLIPCLEIIDAAGLFPVLTPLSPGGNYWDLVFLKTALDYMVLHDKAHLFDRMAVGIHNYVYNKPLDWGRGGPSRWPDAKPYYCPPGYQDHVGYYLFEWYDAIVRARIGRSLPMVCYENGPIVGAHDHSDYPVVDEARHADAAVAMTKMLMDGDLPDYVLNNAFWLLANGQGSPFEAHAWYRSDGRRLSAVDAIKQAPHRPRRVSTDGSQPDQPAPAEKTLLHYVLCPVWEWGVSERYWRLLVNYVKAFRPICGFSAQEAALARYVTIIGRPPGVPQSVEDELKGRGCVVERIAGEDAAEAQRVLDELARQGRRFLSFNATGERKAG